MSLHGHEFISFKHEFTFVTAGKETCSAEQAQSNWSRVFLNHSIAQAGLKFVTVPQPLSDRITGLNLYAWLYF